jgi:hypothetical protein
MSDCDTLITAINKRVFDLDLLIEDTPSILKKFGTDPDFGIDNVESEQQLPLVQSQLIRLRAKLLSFLGPKHSVIPAIDQILQLITAAIATCGGHGTLSKEASAALANVNNALVELKNAVLGKINVPGGFQMTVQSLQAATPNTLAQLNAQLIVLERQLPTGPIGHSFRQMLQKAQILVAVAAQKCK